MIFCNKKNNKPGRISFTWNRPYREGEGGELDTWDDVASEDNTSAANSSVVDKKVSEIKKNLKTKKY